MQSKIKAGAIDEVSFNR